MSHHHHKKGMYSTIRYFEIERDQVHITFIPPCYNCSILQLATVVHLLLCSIYKLKFIIGIHVQEKHTIDRIQYIHTFRHLLGVLEVSVKWYHFEDESFDFPYTDWYYYFGNLDVNADQYFLYFATI